MPIVSIVIPTYNRCDLLPQAIVSALTQATPEASFALQVIVVDDGSTDDTPAQLARWTDDPRVCVVRQTNQGRSAARNHGASLAQGEFLAFLDSDDYYAPGALAAHLHTFQAQPALGMTIGGYTLVAEDGLALETHAPWQTSHDLSPAAWLFDCAALPGSVLLRRSWFTPFDPACEISEDWDLFLRLAADGCRMAWTPQVVCFYRQHAGSSIRQIARHRHGAERTLAKFFARPDLPSALATQHAAAHAWTGVVFARRELVAGQTDDAIASLRAACAEDPTLLAARRLHLLEFLLTPPLPAAAPTWADQIAPSLSRALPIVRRDMARAQSRIAMRQFFAARARHAHRDARRFLWQGLRRDPRWLANRGVLSFLISPLYRPAHSALSASPPRTDKFIWRSATPLVPPNSLDPAPPDPTGAPLISIILPTLNGSRYIAESLRSCLAQTYPHFELIVVDGGSTDGVLDIVRSFDDPRIRIEHQGANRDKLPGALNVGFAAARGDFFTWTQDDDLYTPDALAVMLGHLQTHPETGLVYTGYWRIDAQGKIIGESELHQPDDLWWTNAVGHCFLYRRTVAQRAGPYDVTYYMAEDLEFWLRLYRLAPVARLPGRHFYHRLHDDSLTMKQYGRYFALRVAAHARRTVLGLSWRRYQAQVAAAYIEEAFAAHAQRDAARVRRSLANGLWRNPAWLRNRGVWGIARQALLARPAKPLAE